MLSSWGWSVVPGAPAVSCGPKRGIGAFQLKLSLPLSLSRYLQTGTYLQPEVTMKVHLPPQSHGQELPLSFLSGHLYLKAGWIQISLLTLSPQVPLKCRFLKIFVQVCVHVCVHACVCSCMHKCMYVRDRVYTRGHCYVSSPGVCLLPTSCARMAD